MREQHTPRPRPYSRRLPPVPDQPAQPVPQTNRHSLSRNRLWRSWKAAHGPSYRVESALRPAFQRYRRLGTILIGARSIACATPGMARVAPARTEGRCCASDAVAEEVAVVHARLGQGLKLKRPVLIRGGDAGVAEPASHRAETSCRMPGFSYGLFARQVPSETMVQTAVQKFLSFWTAPSLIALSPCLLI